MAKVHGKNSILDIAGTALTTFTTDFDLSRTADAAETSAMSQDSKTYVKGLMDATLTFSGQWDGTATTGPDDVVQGAFVGETATFTAQPEGAGTGLVEYSGTGIVTDFSVTSSVADVVAFAATVQVSGDVIRTVQV